MSTIRPITDFPEPYLGLYNNTAAKIRDGGRIAPVKPPVADGYQRVSELFVDADGVNGRWEVVDRLKTEIEAEQRTADLVANHDLYELQNQYLAICDQLTGSTTHAKLGFAELEAIVEGLMATDPQTAMGLSVRLLTLNAALVRAGGVQWWDNCEWKELP